MKNLNQFKDFKHQEFLEQKKLYYLDVKAISNGGGVKVSLLILEDNTIYQNSGNNLGEQLQVTVQHKTVEDFAGFKPLQTECKIVNVKKATIYGDYQNQLSIHADVVSVNQAEDKK